MAKLGDLHVGIIIDEAAFTAKMQKIKSILVNAEQQINKITRAGPKEDLSTAKAQVELRKSQVALESAQLRLQKQKEKDAAGPGQKAEQDSRRALQQQYYQTASLSRLAFMIGGMTTAISLFGRTALTAYVTWEQKMADARAAAQATNREFEEMVALSLSMGRTTIFSAVETAEAMEILAKAGYKATEVIKALDGALLLAGATGESFQTGTELIVAVLSQFEMGADRSAEAANILAGGAQFSLASIQSLGQGLKFVGPTLHMFGRGLDEGVTALAELQNAGIRAQMGGRLLATGLQRINTNAKATQDGLSKLGLTFSQVAPASNSLATIIGNLEKAQERLGDAQKFSAAMTKVFGTESVRVMIPLVALGKEGFDKLQSRINEAGTAEAMMLVRTDTLSFALKKLANVTKNIYIELGKASAEGGIKGFVLGLTELLRKLEQTSPAFKSAIANMGGFAVASGIGTTAVMGSIAAYATMRLAMVELAAATKASSLSFLSILGTWPGFIALLAGASLVTYLLTQRIKAMRNEFEETKVALARMRLETMQNENNLEMLSLQFKSAKQRMEGAKKGSDEYAQAEADVRTITGQLNQIMGEKVGILESVGLGYETLTKKIEEYLKVTYKMQRTDIATQIRATQKEIKELLDRMKIPGGKFRETMTEEMWKRLENLSPKLVELKKKMAALVEEYQKIGAVTIRVETERLPAMGPLAPVELTDEQKAELKRQADEAERVRADLNIRLQKLTLDEFAFEEKEAERDIETRLANIEKLNLGEIEKFDQRIKAYKIFQLEMDGIDKARMDKAALDAQKEADLRLQGLQKFTSMKDALTLMGLEGKDKDKELEQLRQKEQEYYDQVAQLRLEDRINDEQEQQLKTLIAETYAQQRIAVQKKLSDLDEQIARELVSQFEDIVQITEDWKLQLKSIGDIVKDIMNYIIKMMIRMALENLFGLAPVVAAPVRVVEGLLGKMAMPTPVQGLGTLGKMAIPNTAPMQALTQGPLPVLTAAAKRSIVLHQEYNFEGTFLEPEKWFKEKFMPVQRRVAKQKLTGEGE